MVTLGQELNSSSSISFRLIGRCTFFSSGQSEKTQDSAFFTPPGTCICLHPFGLTRSTNACDDLDVRSAIPFNDSIETFCSRDCFHIATRLQKTQNGCFLPALFLQHSLPSGGAAAERHRGEKQGQYASMHRISSFQGKRGSLCPLRTRDNAMVRSRYFFKSRFSPYRRRGPGR